MPKNKNKKKKKPQNLRKPSQSGGGAAISTPVIEKPIFVWKSYPVAIPGAERINQLRSLGHLKFVKITNEIKTYLDWMEVRTSGLLSVRDDMADFKCLSTFSDAILDLKRIKVDFKTPLCSFFLVWVEAQGPWAWFAWTQK